MCRNIPVTRTARTEHSLHSKFFALDIQKTPHQNKTSQKATQLKSAVPCSLRVGGAIDVSAAAATNAVETFLCRPHAPRLKVPVTEWSGALLALAWALAGQSASDFMKNCASWAPSIVGTSRTKHCTAIKQNRRVGDAA